MASARPDSPAPRPCGYDAADVARRLGPDSLSARIYACYGSVVQRVRVDGETLDRLTVLGLLPRTADAARRRRLFLALDTIWRSVNGDDGPSSPYRQLVAASAERWRRRSPVADAARQLGIDPAVVEDWLTSVLAAWRAASPGPALEPWDYYHAAGGASRALSPRIPLERLREINDRYFAALGADPRRLGVRYDLAPREGKTPVAFTTFGARARVDAGRWTPTEPWIFATYRAGGLDNLNELLHETGHAVHIAAIRTRPAFLDWPDNDPWSEGLGDLLALDVYEPAWQRRWLGDSVPTADALRGRYSAIMLDVAWALFEVRMHRDPARSPNAVWTEITSRYLNIAPHPELSWWAMRGQLVSDPGYMMNYALGAIIIADVRARMRELRGAWVGGDPGWYAWASERLYRFGLERSSREVIEALLGRAVSPAALLADLRRMTPAGAPRP